jgi:hypothetical protein
MPIADSAWMVGHPDIEVSPSIQCRTKRLCTGAGKAESIIQFGFTGSSFLCRLQKVMQRLIRVRKKSHWKPFAFSQTRPEAKKPVPMISQPDSAARVCEFAGAISIFPASHGRGVHVIRNMHTAETHPTLRVGVPVGRS